MRLRINLTHKFIAFLLLAAVLPLLIVGASAYQVSRTIVRGEAIRFTQALVDAQRDYLDLQSQQIASLIANLLSVEEITEALASETRADSYTNLATQARIGYILDGYSNLKGLVSIDIFTMNGVHYHVGDTLDVSRLRSDVIERLLLQVRAHGSEVLWAGIEDNVNASSTQQHVLTAAHLVTNTSRGSATSEPVGVLLVNSSVDELHAHFKDINFGEGALLMIIDAQGRVIYHPDAALQGTTIHPSIHDALQGSRGTLTKVIDGQTMLLTYSSSSLSGWTVLSVVPIATLDAQSSTIGLTVLLALAVACLFIMLASTFASRLIVLPLRDLILHLQLLQTGRPGWEAPLRVRGSDEVAELGRWFNTFLETLRARSQAEEALRESEERYALALQGANDGIWDWDLRTDHVHYSARWKAILGYANDEADCSIEAWMRQVHPDDLPLVRQQLEDHLHGATTLFESEHRIRRHNDQAYLWVLARGMTIADDQQRPIRVAGSLTDISNRKLADEALRESEEQARLLFEEAPDAVVLFDDVGRMVRLNRAFERLTGYSAERLTGTTLDVLGLLSTDQFAALRANIIKPLHRLTTAELRLTDAEGVVRDVGVRSFGLTISGRRHYLATMRDITTQKQVEETLRQANAELARAARTKDEFLANMSHELRTPLNAILALGETLQEGIPGPLNERQKTTLHHIVESGNHLLVLINDILDLSKVEAGRLELQLGAAEVGEVCRASLVFVKEVALKKSVKLALQIDDPMTEMEVDSRRLKQMLVNLLSNAVKFTPAGGQVRLEVATDAEAGVIAFRVRDTGIGIAPEDLQRLFLPFQQLDSSLSRQHEGTGLGLALVRRLAELHGGSVTVESAPGQGSCFTIALPYRQPVRAARSKRALDKGALAAAQPEPPQAAPGRMRLLLVEDNEINIRAIEEYLSAKGYQVDVAYNGYEALKRAAEATPEVILMDIQMPEMDGLEAMRRLRAMPTYATTPIIALTALAMPGDRERCLAAGATDYMTKPISLRALHDMIQRLAVVNS